MLRYDLNQQGKAEMILTLTELTTISEPIYVFNFTHALTKTIVTLIFGTKDDKSFFPERYNLFEINPGDLFKIAGEWHYEVLEQQSNTILETGIMLIKSSDFNFTMYNGTTAYSTYNG